MADDIEEQFVEDFLRILSREGCAKTERRIRQEFHIYSDDLNPKQDPEFMYVSSTFLLARECIDVALDQNLRKEELPFSKYRDFQQAISKTQRALLDIFSYADDPDIKEFFYANLWGRNKKTSEKYSEIFKAAWHLNLDLYKFMYQPDTPKGRPSLDAFYGFVSHIARLYEELSGKDFKSYRNKEEKGVHAGEYSPATGGQEFVWKAVGWLHHFAKEIMEFPVPEFSSKNIMNACENAVKNKQKIKSGK